MSGGKIGAWRGGAAPTFVAAPSDDFSILLRLESPRGARAAPTPFADYFLFTGDQPCAALIEGRRAKR
ncbi:uncharacterized protein J3R85_017182 [Psidium guajava]|nr:uncharacterized protein J3R85_017182 [Psidium guajava]